MVTSSHALCATHQGILNVTIEGFGAVVVTIHGAPVPVMHYAVNAFFKLTGRVICCLVENWEVTSFDAKSSSLAVKTTITDDNTLPHTCGSPICPLLIVDRSLIVEIKDVGRMELRSTTGMLLCRRLLLALALITRSKVVAASTDWIITRYSPDTGLIVAELRSQ